MTVQILIAVASLVVAAVFALPLLRSRKAVADRSEYDLAVYRQQLADVDADVARGAVSEDEGESVRLEIERRMLKAARTRSEKTPKTTPRRVLAAAVIVVVPALSLTLYHFQGSPDLPGQPFAERTPDRNPDRDQILALLSRVEQRLKENPNDERGWRLLGQGYLNLGDTSKAAEVFAQAVKVFPDDPDINASYGEALVADSNGVVGPEAVRIFQKVLSEDSSDIAARYYLALSELQAGNAQDAYDKWRAIATDSPADAPWLSTVQRGLDAAAKQLGKEPEDVTKLAKAATSPLPQPSKGDVDAAQSMTKEQRDQFVHSMVERLAARLKESPDDLDGWLRLGQSYTVLGERAKAADAFRKAEGLMKADDPRRAKVEQAIENLSGPDQDTPSDPPAR